MTKKFLSGNEALACGVALARPKVTSLCPAVAHADVAAKLSEPVAAGSLGVECIHAESAQEALLAALNASAKGHRSFTAMSSQQLLGVVDLLGFASSKGLPLVMMNAEYARELSEGACGGHCGAVGLLDCGWIQAYPLDAQEALDLALMAYRIAEDPQVQMPFAIRLDSLALTHGCEVVDVPSQEQADAFLSSLEALEQFGSSNLESGASGIAGVSSFEEHIRMINALDVMPQVEDAFAHIFGRRYEGPVESYRAKDAEYVVIALGTVAGLVCEVVDELRGEGLKVGLLRLRYLRPFPDEQLVAALSGKKAAAVLEDGISFGYEGTVYTNVNSALYTAAQHEGLMEALPKTFDYVGGLDGNDITREDVHTIFATMIDGQNPASHAFLGMGA